MAEDWAVVAWDLVEAVTDSAAMEAAALAVVAWAVAGRVEAAMAAVAEGEGVQVAAGTKEEGRVMLHLAVGVTGWAAGEMAMAGVTARRAARCRIGRPRA